jgi:hypothetical protein
VTDTASILGDPKFQASLRAMGTAGYKLRPDGSTEAIDPADFYAKLDDAVDAAVARASLAELLSRHPEWDPSPACPDCGSRDHFECG